MEPTRLPGDLIVPGVIYCEGITLPTSIVGDDQVAATANIAASKLQQQIPIDYRQKTGTAVVTETTDLTVVRGATGSVVSVDADVTTAPTGADRTITIDVQKGNQSTGFATVLNATIVINNTHVARQVLSGSIIIGAGSTLADGDTIRVIVTVAGAAGAQGQGLTVTITNRVKADP